MDKLSLSVLKYIASQQSASLKGDIVTAFGDNASRSLSFLEGENFIRSGRYPIGVGQHNKPVLASDGRYNVTSKGLSYIEERPGKVFDRWSTRIIAIWGAITGTLAVALEIWLHFLR